MQGGTDTQAEPRRTLPPDAYKQIDRARGDGRVLLETCYAAVARRTPRDVGAEGHLPDCLSEDLTTAIVDMIEDYRHEAVRSAFCAHGLHLQDLEEGLSNAGCTTEKIDLMLTWCDGDADVEFPAWLASSRKRERKRKRSDAYSRARPRAHKPSVGDEPSAQGGR